MRFVYTVILEMPSNRWLLQHWGYCVFLSSYLKQGLTLLVHLWLQLHSAACIGFVIFPFSNWCNCTGCSKHTIQLQILKSEWIKLDNQSVAFTMISARLKSKTFEWLSSAPQWIRIEQKIGYVFLSQIYSVTRGLPRDIKVYKSL